MGTVIETSVTMGELYEDKNSGFKGVAVCVSKWQYGCIRVGLQPAVMLDGKLPENQFFDEASLVNVEPIDKSTGGPSSDPTRNMDPRRS